MYKQQTSIKTSCTWMQRAIYLEFNNEDKRLSFSLNVYIIFFIVIHPPLLFDFPHSFSLFRFAVHSANCLHIVTLHTITYHWQSVVLRLEYFVACRVVAAQFAAASKTLPAEPRLDQFY